jgi:hypothetical protein
MLGKRESVVETLPIEFFSNSFISVYSTDLPRSIHSTTGTFTGDTVILARHDDPVTASHKLQGHLDQLEAWLKKWQINVNATKSTQVTFTLRKEQCPAVHIKNTVIPQSPPVKYFGLHLDSRLMWTQHVDKNENRWT